MAYSYADLMVDVRADINRGSSVVCFSPCALEDRIGTILRGLDRVDLIDLLIDVLGDTASVYAEYSDEALRTVLNGILPGYIRRQDNQAS